MLRKISLSLFIFLLSIIVVKAESVYEVTSKYAALGGDWNKVTQEATAWLKEEPNNPVAHKLLSLGYYFTKEYQKSYFEDKILMKNKIYQNKVISWAEDLVKENNQNPWAYFILYSANMTMPFGDASMEETRVRCARAKDALKKAVELNPKFAIAYSSLAQITVGSAMDKKADSSTEEKDSLLAEAMDYATKANALEPNALDTYEGLTEVYLAKKDYASALLNAKKAVEISPDPYTYVMLGMVYFTQKAYTEAVGPIQKAIEIDPNEAFFYSMLSYCYYGNGLYNDAINIANQAIRLDPGRESFLAYFALAMSYGRNHQVEESKRYLQKVIDIDPKGEMGSMAEAMLMMMQPEFIDKVRKELKSEKYQNR